MQRSLVVGVALALLFGAVSGCASTRTADDVLAEKPSGDAREYKVAPDAGWRLVKRTFEMAGFTTVEERRDRSAVVASRELGGESSATVAAGWIEPLPEGMTRITFATMRENAAAPRSPVSVGELHTRFAGLVGLEGR